ncbi:replication-associated recombination protein A [Candidatus Collierbacteria bacterium]|nr:replication-associated recombination protein A [Candidatus Collierbacteria bacterium]
MLLADSSRPLNLNDFIGQKHLVGPDGPIRKMLAAGQIFPMIFWGPPGSGKTTLARIIAKSTGADYHELSAVSAGKSDIKKIIDTPNSPKILFLDEIHRFNKAQQDYLLPFVEKGIITLIGATTENPSFEVISPLLSRCRTYVFYGLTEEDLGEIIKRGLSEVKLSLAKEAIEMLAQYSNGDGRTALNVIDLARKLFPKKKLLSKEDLVLVIQDKRLRYDAAGEEHYNTISAFIKSMRASNVDSALYYLARMVESGEDPLFIARRMVIFASEDIGMAQPTALVVANEVFRACETIGYPECAINLAHGAAYLSLAKKDRGAYNAYFAALNDVKQFGNLPIPLNLRNAPTKLMKELGYSKGYEKYSKEDLLPDKLKGKKYYFSKIK